MKRRTKLKRDKLNISTFIAISFIAVLMMISIGFASLSTTLTIDGRAAFDPVGMIRIMSLHQDVLTDVTENSKRILSPDAININMDIEDLEGSASYDVVIRNLGQTDKQLVNIVENIFSNNDMEYQLIGLQLDDVIEARSELTFKVVFRYKSGVNTITDTRLNAELRFVFEDYVPSSGNAYFAEYNGANTIFGMDKTGIVSFSRNTELTQSQVLAKEGVTDISNQVNGQYKSDYPVYGWIEDNHFYWWSDAEKVYFHPDTTRAFNNFSSITTIDLTGTSTELVKNFAHFFDNDRLLTTITGKINTSGLVLETANFDFANDDGDNTFSGLGLSYMFNDCNALVSVDLSEIDTTNAIDLKRMFGGCKKLANIDISHFNTANAKSMYWMFRNCQQMTEINLTNFDTSSVENFTGMFLSCTKVKKIYFGDDFDTSSAVRMNRMFEANNSLTTIYATGDFIRNAGLTSTNMFKGDTKLVGGAGESYETVFSSSYIDHEYAQIATPSQSGYFTSTSNVTRYTITYNLDGGTHNNPSYYTSITPTFVLNYPTKIGYNFLGWTGSNGNTVQKDVTIPLGTIGNLTYTAHYEPKTYTVVFDANEGTGNMSPQQFTYGTSQALTPNAFTRSGYKFLEWNTSADGSGTSYGNNETALNITSSSSITLYAQWRPVNVATYVFNYAGPCIFNGSNSNITGTSCADYYNYKFINTHVELFNNDNYDEDFDLSFNIDSYVPGQQPEAQVTLLNEMHEENNKALAGFLVRRNTNDLYFLFRGGTEYQYTLTVAAANVQSVRIVRKNNNMCLSINNEPLSYVYSYGNNFSNQFSIPVYFGAAEYNGSARRYIKGTLSNMSIKMGEDDDVECAPST